ncbi:MAG TPA: 16S rRNA (guanine(527)-N(7))-methyltransferase RsmG [Beijerinckiaceae bacterium]|nr:16S rRNA (guanine(527)-N(7))-methyltransferase RsmG [Beijerinckiaceae bacterium]
MNGQGDAVDRDSSGNRERFRALVDVSRETLEALDRYEYLLRRWQGSINLVGKTTLSEVWTRHFLDSLQIADLVPRARTFMDLGSGAGFPGLVIAIRLKERGIGRITLIDSSAKKTAFLTKVQQTLELPAEVVTGRLEQWLPRLPVPEIVTARALAPLTQLLDWCEPLLKSGSRALFLKGRNLDNELSEAAQYWEIDFVRHAHALEAESWILEVRSARRRTPPSGT